MGIYINGSILEYKYIILTMMILVIYYEETYDEMREAYLFYDNLNDKNNIFIKIYIECSSTLSYNRYKFLEKFGV